MENKEGQCYTCHTNAMFQYFGQTPEYNEVKIKDEYIAAIASEKTITCITCARKITYTKDGNRLIEQVNE